jgi:hypothetical protein
MDVVFAPFLRPRSIPMVFDSSEGSPVAFVYGDYPSIQGLPSFITLNGYLENCSITGCPTIQR